MFGQDGSVLAEKVETAKLADRLEEDRITACHVLKGMARIRWVGDHFQISPP